MRNIICGKVETAEKDVKTVKVTESASGEGYLIAGHVYKSTEILNIPVLENDDAEYIFDNIFHFAILDFSKSFHTELESLLVNPVEVPKHLRGQVPEALKYQICRDAFVMALFYQGSWNGWYKNEYAGKNENVPAIVICLGKKV